MYIYIYINVYIHICGLAGVGLAGVGIVGVGLAGVSRACVGRAGVGRAGVGRAGLRHDSISRPSAPATTHDCGRPRPRPRLKLQRSRLTTTTAFVSKEISQVSIVEPEVELTKHANRAASNAYVPQFFEASEATVLSGSPKSLFIIVMGLVTYMIMEAYFHQVVCAFLRFGSIYT